jgi:cytochrome c oxidase subunit 3
MRVLHALTEKPWVAVADPAAAPTAGGTPSLPASTLGLRFLLAVVTVLFSLLIVAYAQRMAFEDWRPAPQPWLLWLNTTFLVLASVGMQWARIGVRQGRLEDVWAGLVVGGLFAVAFLVGQLFAWQQLQMLAAFDVTNPAIAFFYLITGLHGLHIAGGLVAWARTVARLWGDDPLARSRRSVELCTTYWHYLLLVWLALFGLLFSGNDNLELLLTICGLR